MLAHELPEHTAEVRCHREVPAFEELFGLEPWPLAEHPAATNRPPKHEHHVAVPVVGSVVAVFGGRAPELRHRHQHDVLHPVAHVFGERGERVAELREQPWELSVLVAVMIPAADFGKRRLDADTGFYETRDLSQTHTELAEILRAHRRRVWCPVDRLDGLERVERPFALRSHQRCVRFGVHAFEDRGGRVVADAELLQIAHRNRAAVAAHRARHLRANRHRANRRRVGCQRRERAIQPSIFGRPAGCARFHRVLRLEVGTIAIRRPARVDDAELPAVPQRLQGLQRRMQREAAIEIDRAVVLTGRGDCDRRSQFVIALLEVGHDDVQTVGGATLKDGDEDLVARALARGGRANEPRRSRAHAGHGDGGCTHEIASRKHGYLLWKSGELMTSVASIDGVASFSWMPFSMAVSVAGVGAVPSRSLATAAGALKLNRLTSTRMPGMEPALNAVAKSIRPMRPALLAHVSPVVGYPVGSTLP